MKLKILTATTKVDLEEEFNTFSDSHKIVQVTPDSDNMTYILFVFYEESPVYKKEGDEFMKELSSKEDIDKSLENNYSFFKSVNSFLK